MDSMRLRARYRLTSYRRVYWDVRQRGGGDAFVDEAHQPLEFRAFGIAGIRQRILQNQTEATRTGKQHNDAGGHFYRFFDVVRDHKD